MTNCDKAYRGYLIRVNPINGDRWVEKDRTLIQQVFDEKHGREVIDELFADRLRKPPTDR